MQQTVRYILSGLGLVLIQGVIIQQITLGTVADYFVPFIYPMFILVLPYTFSKHWILVVALVSGVFVDMFYNTPGLNASAAVLIAFLRPYALSLLEPREGFDEIRPPGYNSMGMNRFIAYVAIMMFIYHLWFFSLEILKISYIHIILLKAFFSTLLATVLIVIIEILSVPKRK